MDLKLRTIDFQILSCIFHLYQVADLLGEGNGTPLQYSCLENPMDGGAWRAAVHGVAEGRARLSDFTFTFHFHALEKEMATHSSVIAWRFPGTGEPGGLLSMGSHRVGHDWSDLAADLLCKMKSLHFLNKEDLIRDLERPDGSFQWSCMDVRVGLWRKLSAKELMLLNCGVGEDSWESLGLQGDPTSPS